MLSFSKRSGRRSVNEPWDDDALTDEESSDEYEYSSLDGVGGRQRKVHNLTCQFVPS